MLENGISIEILQEYWKVIIFRYMGSTIQGFGMRSKGQLISTIKKKKNPPTDGATNINWKKIPVGTSKYYEQVSKIRIGLRSNDL